MASGVDFKIYVNKGEVGSPQYVAVGGQRGGKLNRSGSEIDVTTKDTGGWKASKVGLLEWSIDGDGVFVESDEGFKLLEGAFLQRKEVLVKMGTATGLHYKGKAVVTDFPLDMPYDNEITYSVKLKGTGALEKAESTVLKASK